MKSKFLIIALVIFIGSIHFVNAKNNSTKIKGSVIEKVGNQEQPIALAYVYIDNTVNCTYTNVDGTFSLDVPEGKHNIKVVFKGYKTITKEYNSHKNIPLKIELTPEAEEVAEK